LGCLSRLWTGLFTFTGSRAPKNEGRPFCKMYSGPGDGCCGRVLFFFVSLRLFWEPSRLDLPLLWDPILPRFPKNQLLSFFFFSFCQLFFPGSVLALRGKLNPSFTQGAHLGAQNWVYALEGQHIGCGGLLPLHLGSSPTPTDGLFDNSAP